MRGEGEGEVVEDGVEREGVVEGRREERREEQQRQEEEEGGGEGGEGGRGV